MGGSRVDALMSLVCDKNRVGFVAVVVVEKNQSQKTYFPKTGSKQNHHNKNACVHTGKTSAHKSIESRLVASGVFY